MKGGLYAGQCVQVWGTARAEMCCLRMIQCAYIWLMMRSEGSRDVLKMGWMRCVSYWGSRDETWLRLRIIRIGFCPRPHLPIQKYSHQILKTRT